MWWFASNDNTSAGQRRELVTTNYSMLIENVRLLRALKASLQNVDKLGYGTARGAMPCALGYLCYCAGPTPHDIPGGRYENHYLAVIPVQNDKYGPDEDPHDRCTRIKAWVDERLLIEEAYGGHRTNLTDEEIAELTTMPVAHQPPVNV